MSETKTRTLLRHDRNLWSINRSLRYLGAEIGHRMTVVRLADGGLVLHSPVELDAAITEDLARLGSVAVVLAPNKFHDLYLEPYRRRFAGAQFLGAPGFREGHAHLAFTGELEDGPQAWSEGALEVLLVRGMPRFNECVFLHRPTRTLVVADLLFNLSGKGSTYVGKWLLWFLGTYRTVGSSRLFRSCIEDRLAFRGSIDQLLSWDFRRIVMGHGGVIASGAKELLRRAYAAGRP